MRKPQMTPAEWHDFWICMAMAVVGCAVMYGMVWALWIVL